tara:strand:- start:4070 stop:4399 length:330 start_codon:yes stop_codon:yes gene_type:complete
MFFIDFFEKLITCNVSKKENNNIYSSSNDCFEGYIPYLKDCCNKKNCCDNKKNNKKSIITNIPDNLNKEKILDNIYHSSNEENINNIRYELEEKMIFKQNNNNNSRIAC